MPDHRRVFDLYPDPADATATNTMVRPLYPLPSFRHPSIPLPGLANPPPSYQVLPLLHNRRLPNNRLHPPPPLAHLPAPPAAQHRHDRRLRPLRAVAGRAHRHLHPAVGARRLRQLQLQPVCVWRQPDAFRADGADAGVAAAEGDLPELAGRVCFWVGRGDFFVVDYGYGLSGFC